MHPNHTITRRVDGPPTSCHRCGGGPIWGFDVVDHDHGIHRVLCVDCARSAGEATQDQGLSGVTGWCEACGCSVAVEEHCGNTRLDGSDEFLCPECYVPASSMSPESQEYARALDPHAVREPTNQPTRSPQMIKTKTKTRRSRFRVGDRVTIQKDHHPHPVPGVVVETSGRMPVMRRVVVRQADCRGPQRTAHILLEAPGVDVELDRLGRAEPVVRTEAHDDQVTRRPKATK